jgi:hypothetical protein
VYKIATIECINYHMGYHNAKKSHIMLFIYGQITIFTVFPAVTIEILYTLVHISRGNNVFTLIYRGHFRVLHSEVASGFYIQGSLPGFTFRGYFQVFHSPWFVKPGAALAVLNLQVRPGNINP